MSVGSPSECQTQQQSGRCAAISLLDLSEEFTGWRDTLAELSGYLLAQDVSQQISGTMCGLANQNFWPAMLHDYRVYRHASRSLACCRRIFPACQAAGTAVLWIYVYKYAFIKGGTSIDGNRLGDVLS